VALPKSNSLVSLRNSKQEIKSNMCNSSLGLRNFIDGQSTLFLSIDLRRQTISCGGQKPRLDLSNGVLCIRPVPIYAIKLSKYCFSAFSLQSPRLQDFYLRVKKYTGLRLTAPIGNHVLECYGPDVPAFRLGHWRLYRIA